MNSYKTPSLNIFTMVRYTKDLHLLRERKTNDRFSHFEFQDRVIVFLNSPKEVRTFKCLEYKELLLAPEKQIRVEIRKRDNRKEFSKAKAYVHFNYTCVLGHQAISIRIR